MDTEVWSWALYQKREVNNLFVAVPLKSRLLLNFEKKQAVFDAVFCKREVWTWI